MARAILIIADYANGVSVIDIQNKFECSRQTVLRLARAAGLPKRPKCFPEQIRRSALAMLELKRPLAEIKASLGCSEAYLSKLAKENNLARYKRNKR